MSDKYSILVLDDDTIITNLLQTILEMANYSVKAFNDPEKALDYYLKNPEAFHLLIVDFQMPKMNGIDFSRKIRHQNPTVPIMMLTAFSNPYLINNAADLNICEYIIKPFKDIKAFTSAIRKNIGLEGVDHRLEDFYQQFFAISEQVLSDRAPRDFTSASFIVRTLEINQYQPKKLEVLKKMLPLLMEHIKFLEAQESYLALKRDYDARKATIKKLITELKAMPG